MEAKQLTKEEMKKFFFEAVNELKEDIETLEEKYNDDKNTLETLARIKKNVKGLKMFRDYDCD